MRIFLNITSVLLIVCCLAYVPGSSYAQTVPVSSSCVPAVSPASVVGKPVLVTSPAAISGKLASVTSSAGIRAEGMPRWVVCIDPGHQKTADSKKEPIARGSRIQKAKTTSGTQGVVTGIPEHVLTLELSHLLKKLLEVQGVLVVMTREKADVRMGNIERAEVGNEANADLTVRIHADGSESASVSGISVLVPGDKYLKDEILLKNSRTAGERLHAALKENTPARMRGIVSRNDLTGFNWSLVPVVLVEVGFMTNPKEDRKLKTDEYRAQLADAMVKGILAYLGSKSEPHAIPIKNQNSRTNSAIDR